MRERVARGARLLDQRAPGWWHRVSVLDLDISDPAKCVLGQVFGRYGPGVGFLAVDDPAEYGFTLGDAPPPSHGERGRKALARWQALTDAWSREICARLIGYEPSAILVSDKNQ